MPSTFSVCWIKCTCRNESCLVSTLHMYFHSGMKTGTSNVQVWRGIVKVAVCTPILKPESVECKAVIHHTTAFSTATCPTCQWGRQQKQKLFMAEYSGNREGYDGCINTGQHFSWMSSLKYDLLGGCFKIVDQQLQVNRHKNWGLYWV